MVGSNYITRATLAIVIYAACTNGLYTETGLKNEYDFIIVGAGSAGSVVADRLSENVHTQVLLIEAGGYPTNETEIPANTYKLLNSSMNWKFDTAPQLNSCKAFTNQQCKYARGKVLGGTSSINEMIYIRGNHKDYDHWASLGNDGWSWRDVLPYFLKSEGNTIPWMANDTTYHNSEGNLTVSQASYTTPSLKIFLEAVQANHYSYRDVNGQFQRGVMPSAFTIRNGSRCSTYKAFLQPALGRKNLKVLTNSHVLKVLFNEQNQTTGVLFSKDGKTYTAKANKEVILSAGTIGSPQILLLSGVGSSGQLNRFKIPIVADLPGVGENLQDHVGTLALVFSVNTSITFDPKLIQSPESLYQWLNFRLGPLTLPSAIEGVGFIDSSQANQFSEWPDIQLAFSSTSMASSSSNSVNRVLGLKQNVFSNYFAPLARNSTFTLYPMVLRPKSKGSIKLQSSDPYVSPIIDVAYFTHPDDIKTLTEGIKFCLELVNSTAFRAFDAQLNPSITPGCENHTQYSDDYWACTSRQLTLAGLHASGSCKMGNATDAMSVVNSQLKVYKVKGLRVIDASIMPNIVSGNTNAPAIMIGEKGSDLIKQEWGLV